MDKNKRSMGEGDLQTPKIKPTLGVDGLCDGLDGEDSKLEVAVVLVRHQRRNVDN